MVEAAGIEKLLALANADALTAESLSIITAGRKFTCDDVLEAWREEMRLDVADGTLSIYTIYLNLLFDDLGCHRNMLGWIKRHQLDKFVNGPDIKISTRQIRLSSIRSLWKFASGHAYILGDLASTIRVRRRDLTHRQQERAPAIPLTEREYRLIAENPSIPRFWQQATILSYWLSLRIGDVFRMETDSINDLSVTIWTNKRGKRVELPLGDPLIGSPELLAVLKELKATGEAYCFPEQREIIIGPKRHHLSMGYIRLLEKWGIEWKSFHSLRSSCIQRWDAAGKTLFDIGRLAAHANEATTKIYLQRKA